MGLAAPIEGAGVAGVPVAGRVTRGVAYSRLEIWELRTRGDETNLVVANKYPNPTPRHKVAVSQAEEALAPFGDQHCRLLLTLRSALVLFRVCEAGANLVAVRVPSIGVVDCSVGGACSWRTFIGAAVLQCGAVKIAFSRLRGAAISLSRLPSSSTARALH